MVRRWVGSISLIYVRLPAVRRAGNERLQLEPERAADVDGRLAIHVDVEHPVGVTQIRVCVLFQKSKALPNNGVSVRGTVRRPVERRPLCEPEIIVSGTATLIRLELLATVPVEICIVDLPAVNDGVRLVVLTVVERVAMLDADSAVVILGIAELRHVDIGAIASKRISEGVVDAATEEQILARSRVALDQDHGALDVTNRQARGRVGVDH